jgi:AraC-like DNA-binding protein
LDRSPTAAASRGFAEYAAEELRDAASMVPLNVDVLSSTKTPSRIRQMRSPQGWSFDTAALNAHVRARGGFDGGCIVVLAVMRGADATICGVPLEEGVVLTIPDGLDITARIKPGLIYSASVLPWERWREIASMSTGIHGDRPPREPAAIRLSKELSGRARAGLAAALASIGRLDDADNSGDMPAPLTDYLGLLATAAAGEDALELRLDRSLRQRQRQAWLAEDFVHAHLDEDLSIMRLCREIKVSRRQLEYAFRTTFDMGPGEYIRLTRLNEGRRRLMAARAKGRTVTEVAMEVGMTHLGRFAEGYRLLFGETPSQTLAGGRA